MTLACCQCGTTIEGQPGVRYAKCPECKPYTPEQRDRRYATRNANRKERYRTDPFFRDRVRLAHRVSRCIVRNIEDPQVVAALGCRVATVRARFERKFTRGMSWANHATRWHVDHIHQKRLFYKDVEAGRMTAEECFRRVHHHTNLRPLRIMDNLHRPWRLREAA